MLLQIKCNATVVYLQAEHLWKNQDKSEANPAVQYPQQVWQAYYEWNEEMCDGVLMQTGIMYFLTGLVLPTLDLTIVWLLMSEKNWNMLLL